MTPWQTAADVAAALDLAPEQLRWLATPTGAARRYHYRTFTLPKPSGGVRQILAPTCRLKAVQRRLLGLFEPRLRISPHAHGFQRGRSIATHARLHAGRAVVVCCDLADFFGSVVADRVWRLLASAGYGDEAAAVLTRLLTESVRHEEARDGTTWHVPVGPRHTVQGAPTSPLVCNAVAYRLDCRLAGLARSCGWIYSRYADDLTFSGDDPGRIRWLLGRVRRIVQDEGFRVNERKTRVMHRHQRQRVCGVTVNSGTAGLSRQERRRLRAALHQVRAAGEEADPARAARVQGRLAYLHMLDPGQARRLVG